MKALGRVAVSLSLTFLMVACGCGGDKKNAAQTAPVAPPPASLPAGSTLAGNWLITPSAPTSSFLLGDTSSDHVRLALTFDVTGDNIVAGGFTNHFCGTGVSLSVSSALSGTVAQDGSFNLQSKTGLPASSSITGKAPDSQGSPWSGTYTLTFTGFPSGLTQSCDETVSSSFTATYLPLVSGVYTGTATPMSSLPSESSTVGPITVELTLQQGGTATDVVSGKTISGNGVLTGSIKVQGSPCFTTGTTTGGLSNVVGNRIQAMFAMNDGSFLAIVGTVADPAEMRIATSSIRVSSPCGSTSPVLYFLSELDKQM